MGLARNVLAALVDNEDKSTALIQGPPWWNLEDNHHRRVGGFSVKCITDYKLQFRKCLLFSSAEAGEVDGAIDEG